MDASPPNDRFYFVWLIFMIHGIGTLLPWNMFITANDYFVDYKFNTSDPNHRAEAQNYGHNYLAYTGLASKLPNLSLQLINFFYTTKTGSINFRITISLFIQIIIFALTILLTILDSSTWVSLFFTITMVSIVLINMANGVYQSCLFGLAANLPSSYTNAIVTGMNLSGTYSAIILILSITISPDQQIAAVFYFSTAIIFLLICLVTYLILIKNRHFQYYQRLDSSVRQSIIKTENDSIESESNVEILRKIRKQIILPSLNIFLVFFVSLSLFPGVLSSIEPVGHLISKKYFSPIVCFLFFNAFAVLGNLISRPIDKIHSPLRYTIPILMRFLFIPYFIFCNVNPSTRSIPVYLENDYFPIIGTIVLALTQGYYTSKSQMYLPKCVDVKYASIAGMIASFMIMIGILAGISISPFLNYLITIK